MGLPQQGLPFPSTIPWGWHIIIVVWKDCFFTIPLAKQNCPHFAFSLPSVTFKEPALRFHWIVLPQGMASSPTICQAYVAAALESVCCQFLRLYIVHYMADLLVTGPDQDQLLKAYTQMQQDLEKAGLIIAPGKVQM